MSNERDTKEQAIRALLEMAAQIMRIAAGGGSKIQLVMAFRQLKDATGDVPHADLMLASAEAAEALSFENYGELDFNREDREEREDIVRHALRLVASRYERNKLQEKREMPEIVRTAEELVRVRAELRAESPRTTDADVLSRRTAKSLPIKMQEALNLADIKDPNADAARRQVALSTLVWLQRNGLISVDWAARDYSLTRAGRSVLRLSRR